MKAKYKKGDPLIVFDGVCHFCSKSMALVYRYEKTEPIFFAPMQSDMGKALMVENGLNPNDPRSFLFLYQDQVRTSSSAVFALAKLLKVWPRLIRVFLVVPRPITDWAYGVFARNRYTWFGRSQICMIPTPDMRARLLDMPRAEGAQ